MNMFARFDEIPAMTLQDIKETKHYGRMDGQHENSIPSTNKVCGGIKTIYTILCTWGIMKVESIAEGAFALLLTCLKR